jgi:hypothetical protein
VTRDTRLFLQNHVVPLLNLNVLLLVAAQKKVVASDTGIFATTPRLPATWIVTNNKEHVSKANSTIP